MAHHLIFEGAELSGKSWLVSQIYDYLEPKYNQNKVTLDGCHWFNCDVGVYGTNTGKPVIRHYLKIFQALQDKNLLIEKFHLSDIVYNRLHRQREIDYQAIERQLQKLHFKIILSTFPDDKNILKKRIADRLALYPHYERILREPEWYLRQQREDMAEITKSTLEYLVVETNQLPDVKLVQKILKFIKEKQ